MKELFFLYGPPASGKTTAINSLKIIIPSLDYLSVGDITRQEISQKTDMGKKLSYFLVNNIQYPPNLFGEIFIKLILESKCKKIIIDGFPKYKEEANYLLGSLDEYNMLSNIKGLIFFNISTKDCLIRIKNRRICSDCKTQQEIKNLSCVVCHHCGGINLSKREDDNEKDIKARLDDFSKSKEEVSKALKGFPCFEIDSSMSRGEITASLEKVLL